MIARLRLKSASDRERLARRPRADYSMIFAQHPFHRAKHPRFVMAVDGLLRVANATGWGGRVGVDGRRRRHCRTARQLVVCPR
jgi:hypothetical protein